MVLLVDNYDSFTWNLAQELGQLGARVIVRRNDEVSVADVAGMAPERIVISPGPITDLVPLQHATKGIMITTSRAFRSSSF